MLHLDSGCAAEIVVDSLAVYFLQISEFALLKAKSLTERLRVIVLIMQQENEDKNSMKDCSLIILHYSLCIWKIDPVFLFYALEHCAYLSAVLLIVRDFLICHNLCECFIGSNVAFQSEI